MNELGSLRQITSEDLELMRSWRNEPNVRVNMYTQHVISSEEHSTWWNKTKVDLKQRYFMYEFQGVPTGIASFNGIDNQNLNSSWAFYTSPLAAKGTGSKMEFLMIDFSFKELALKKLYCEVLAFNGSVIKLHQKFGFQIEGIFRNQFKIDNDFADIYRLGILSHEWYQLRDDILIKIRKMNSRLK